jgi:hypothetical protein
VLFPTKILGIAFFASAHMDPNSNFESLSRTERSADEGASWPAIIPQTMHSIANDVKEKGPRLCVPACTSAGDLRASAGGALCIGEVTGAATARGGELNWGNGGALRNTGSMRLATSHSKVPSSRCTLKELVS